MVLSYTQSKIDKLIGYMKKVNLSWLMADCINKVSIHTVRWLSILSH